MRKNLIIFSILILVGIILYRIFLAPEFMFTEYSPDNQYRIDVYTQKRFFSMPGGGGIGSRIAIVELKNKWGFTIGKSSDGCSVLYDDIEIEWDYSSNEVWYARAKTINLKTGKSGC
jgi:hypothetical protein